MALVGLFALFHGHVHGAEMPQTASGLAYGAGFVLATASLHAVGIGLGLAIYRPGDRLGDRHGSAFGRRVAQAAGSAMAAIGLLMLAGIG
jgi:urease accessory protein